MKWNIIKLNSIDSTNNYLLGSLKKGQVDHYTVVTANEQTDGKGLDTNKWESEPGKNLTFSVLLKPDFLEASMQFFLHMVISNAIYEAVEKVTGKKEFSIKWPNDIYAGKGKLGGILINNTIQGVRINHSVVGIGLNINQEKFVSDAPNPVSLKHITNSEYKPGDVLFEILTSLDKNYHLLRTGKYYNLKELYLKRLFRGTGFHNFKKKNIIFRARITNISETGKLCLEKMNGTIQKYDFKEVEFVI